MVNVERLYELYNVIDEDKDNAAKHEAAFKEILTGVKAGPLERRLASQFIAKFFSLFPNLQEQALSAEFDLCEDDDVSIRKQAVKDLPTLCRVRPDLVPKVADILAQLLQMDDPIELVAVQNALLALFKIDCKGALTGLFYQIENSGEDVVRERCVRFLHSKMKVLGPQVFTPEIEALILKEAKKVLQEASEEEFLLMMGILKDLKSCKTVKGYQQLVDLVSEQCDFTASLIPSDVEIVHRLSSCVKQAIPFFSYQVRSTQFTEYMLKEVVPVLDQLDSSEGTAPSLTLDLLKSLAELLPYADTLEDLETKVAAIFAQLLEVMPLPPEGEGAAEALEKGVSLEFSRVECLLYIFHYLAKQNQDFLAANPDKLKDFRARLQYFARASQAYQKRLREELANKKGAELKTEENRIKLIALKTTANINALIKDLFHQPPSYKAHITLSWKATSAEKAAMSNGGEKRHTPITFDSPGGKTTKGERKIYAPPRDKYSSSAGQFSSGRGRGSGRGARGLSRGGRGGFRGYRGGYRNY